MYSIAEYIHIWYFWRKKVSLIGTFFHFLFLFVIPHRCIKKKFTINSVLIDSAGASTYAQIIAKHFCFHAIHI